jgi:hypothetical protein
MNEMKELEARLHSWAPRRPSRRIEKRLFGRRPRHTGPAFNWLAPVTAALLLTCLIFNQHGSQVRESGAHEALVAVVLSNQSSAAYLPGSFQRDANIITANTFEWTNGSRFTSSIRSLSGPKRKLF